jgi:leucyl aminopeptidase
LIEEVTIFHRVWWIFSGKLGIFHGQWKWEGDCSLTRREKTLALVGISGSDNGLSFGQAVTAIAKETKSKTIETFLPVTHVLNQIVAGLYEGTYVDKRYKSKNLDETEHEWAGIQSISFVGVSEAIRPAAEQQISLSSKTARGVTFARELVG